MSDRIVVLMVAVVGIGILMLGGVIGTVLVVKYPDINKTLAAAVLLTIAFVCNIILIRRSIVDFTEAMVMTIMLLSAGMMAGIAVGL